MNYADKNDQEKTAGKTAAMEQETIYHDYRIKTYLNAEHYIFINGKKGTQHPHTFEISVYTRFPGTTFIEFKELEDTLAGITVPYQNRCLNDIEPFDRIIPTTENMADYFAGIVSEKISGLGGIVLQMTVSETPTRAYVITFETTEALKDKADEAEEKIIDDLIDRRLDAVIKNMA